VSGFVWCNLPPNGYSAPTSVGLYNLHVKITFVFSCARMFAVNFGLESSTFVYRGYPSHAVGWDGIGCGEVYSAGLKPGATVRGTAASLAVPRSVQSKHIIASSINGQ